MKLAHMKTAYNYAACSTAVRLQVGAIIVKDDAIISIGYNGQPSGWDNDCEYKHYSLGNPNDFELKTKSTVLHAESNAISKLAKLNGGGLNSAIFITHCPCLDCAKTIYQAGIAEVYYAESYRDTLGLDFLVKCGLTVEQVHV